jgi:phosphatidylserine decarboxylase
MTAMIDRLKAWPLYVLPHHWISRVVFRLTRLRTPLKNPAMRAFVRAFDVDMRDAAEPDLRQYPHFNAFFTRALKPGARPLPEDPLAIASPVDGTVSQVGDIRNGRIFQAKNHDYSLLALLGGKAEYAEAFDGGKFATLYLSPRDYHRIHMPVDARLTAQIYVPGRLFSVVPHTVNTVPGLFARNERVVAIFDSACGPMAMILVGAINVAAIETVWSGLVTPPPRKGIKDITFVKDTAPDLARGDEMGRFNMGSTVIVLFGNNVAWLPELQTGAKIRMGQAIASRA